MGYRADLLYHEVKWEYQAKGDALWFFVNQDYRATFKIYWVDPEHQADLKVYRVCYPYQAKWRTSHPLRNRLSRNDDLLIRLAKRLIT